MTDKLNPCPFCGTSAAHGLTKKEYDALHGEPNQGYTVYCPKSHARITVSAFDKNPKQTAFDLWNTRADDWQPIETAPKHEWVLTWSPFDYFTIARLDCEYFDEPTWVMDSELSPIRTPTHWMPLPEPPKQEKTND